MWTQTGRFSNQEIENVIADLKAVGSFNKEKWVKLARLLKKQGMFEKAETAYVAARYCDIEDRDLMREWLAVYTLNRAEERTKGRILEEANMINEAMFEVRLDTQRLLHEVQHLLWMIGNTGEFK